MGVVSGTLNAAGNVLYTGANVAIDVSKLLFPGVGAAFSGAEAVRDLFNGEIGGFLLNGAAAVVNLVPVVGPATTMAITAVSWSA